MFHVFPDILYPHNWFSTLCDLWHIVQSLAFRQTSMRLWQEKIFGHDIIFGPFLDQIWVHFEILSHFDLSAGLPVTLWPLPKLRPAQAYVTCDVQINYVATVVGKLFPKRIYVLFCNWHENYCPQYCVLNFWAPFALQLSVLLSIYSTSVWLGLVSWNINSKKRYKQNTRVKMSVLSISIKLLGFVMSHIDRHNLLFYIYNNVLETVRLKVSR
jgi:hypothetical protein